MTEEPVSVKEIEPGIFGAFKGDELLRGGFSDRRTAFMWLGKKGLRRPDAKRRQPPPEEILPELESERLLSVSAVSHLNSECMQTTRTKLKRGEFGQPIRNGKQLYVTLRDWRRWKILNEVHTA